MVSSVGAIVGGEGFSASLFKCGGCVVACSEPVSAKDLLVSCARLVASKVAPVGSARVAGTVINSRRASKVDVKN
jgi:hypothetical protein